MTDFLFNEELDVPFLRNAFGQDYFAAREVLGSFVESASHDIPILQAALERSSLRAFSRITMRMVHNLQLVGLEDEVEHIRQLRSHVAGFGVNARSKELAEQFINGLDYKKNLMAVEVDRLDRHIESQVRHG